MTDRMSSRSAGSATEGAPRSDRPGRTPKDGRSGIRFQISRETFNAILDSIVTLSKAQQKYHSYTDAIRVALSRLQDLNRTDLLILYRNYNTLRKNPTGRISEMVTINMSLHSLDRDRVMKISDELYQITHERLSQASVVVLLLLSSGLTEAEQTG